MKLVRCKKIRTLHRGKRYADVLPCATLFARGLRERYVTRRNAWRALHLLMRAASYDVIQKIINRCEVHRNLFIVRAPLARELAVSSEGRTDIRGIARGIIPLASRSEQGSLVKTDDHKSLWVDVVERHRRIEMSNVKDRRPTVTQVGDQSTSPMFPGVYPKMETSSMPLIVRAAPDAGPTRSPTRSNNGALAEGTDLTPMEDAASHARATSMRQVTSVPEHDMERLADRVIGRIDQRIAAHRERLGRS